MVATRPLDVLVILDGASEPLGLAPTSLERAATPGLDALCRGGSLTRVRTVAPWLEAGSESAIPALLGWVPPAAVDRGAVEAAARGIAVPDGCRAWRVDVRDAGSGMRADAARVREALAETLAIGAAATTRAASAEPPAARPRHEVHALGGHRLLVVGPAPLPSLPALTDLDLLVWPEGILPPPHTLGPEAVVVGARGAAAGIARLMGAHVVTPDGATGRPGSDLAAKARAALAAVEDGAARIVVHVGGPDEAAHELDAAAKVRALETADREVIAPLAVAVAVAEAGGTLRVCPDHGCDPATGRHDAAPVPCVTWAPAFAQSAPRDAKAAPRIAQAAPRRLTERAVATAPLVELAQRERAAA